MPLEASPYQVRAFLGRPFRPGRPSIETTYQFVGQVDSADGFEQARRTATGWLVKKFPTPFPEDARAGASFSSELPGQRVEVVAIPDQGIWAARLEHPDTDNPPVAGRTWVTDIAIGRRETGEVRVGARVACASLPDSDAPITLTRPRFVRDWAERLKLISSRPVQAEPWLVNVGDLDALMGLLIDPDRNLPVVVLTQPDQRQHQLRLAPWVLDPAALAKPLVGVAHVVTLSWDASFEWTKRVGKPWSIFGGAVRTYMPDLNFDSQPPWSHPVVRVEAILASSFGDLKSERAFERILVGRLYEVPAARRFRWDGLLFAPEAKSRAAEIDRRRVLEQLRAHEDVSGKVGQLQLEIDAIAASHQAEIDGLTSQINELQQRQDHYCDMVDSAENDLRQVQDENRNLKRQMFDLREKLQSRSDRPLDESIPIPEGYDDLPEWVGQYLAGRLVLHSRALRSLKDGIYDDPPTVYKALLLLANEYREMRLAGGPETFQARLAEMHLECEGSITEHRAGEEGETYYVNWPLGSNKREFLRDHLRRGSSKDERKCLRIYFFWDSESQQVVVGWLPSHLPNRMT